MKKTIAAAALAGLAACSSNPENKFYEVTQRTESGVNIQMNIGNMKRDGAEVAQMLFHMDKMAVGECSGDASVISERTNTAGPYYTWVERVYECQ